ncbi:MAG TPA: type I methionyl aminopeptidase [Kouleothrix sp.]|uniref:type I methionyl aminopeptidase n=1 Tax=Kouleothrix sp. TaxID=2779161 RepID=UPI002D064C5C|nr:type I methionyl aminopeptidase [Kouleothrix sp.]HRC76740.1 type I methionyl aminopeptidase [Kouleothrix sp.]
MAISLRSRQQIALLREAGRLVAETFEHLRPHVQPGITTRELDRMAEKFIRARGAIPVYKGYNGFPATICVAINNVICHGIPDKTQLHEGDIIGVDIGAKLDGWIGDSCVTLPVGAVAPEVQRLLDVTEECMWRGIRVARAGNRLGDVGAAIQEYAEANGFSVVREYTGHGVGQVLHDEPRNIPHYGKPGTGLRLQPGLVFTVEPMINVGKPDTTLDRRDGWTVRTADGSLSAQFEHSIAVTDGEPIILTAL